MKPLWIACISMFVLATASAQASDTASSIYNLDAQLTNQAGETHGIDVYRGQPVLVTMFYASCPVACPLLIDTVRAVERSIPTAQAKNLRVLLISIDPEHDTTAALAKLTQERRIDASRWTLASTDERTVRKIAALLNIQYRKLPNGGYNHSSVITLLSPEGEIVSQSSVLGKADATLVDTIRSLPPAVLAVTP